MKFVSQWQSSYSNSVQTICRADVCLVHQVQTCVTFTMVTPANPQQTSVINHDTFHSQAVMSSPRPPITAPLTVIAEQWRSAHGMPFLCCSWYFYIVPLHLKIFLGRWIICLCPWMENLIVNVDGRAEQKAGTQHRSGAFTGCCKVAKALQEIYLTYCIASGRISLGDKT